MDRVFLDANVLFSAAYREDSGLLKLWRLRGVSLLTSTYALEEASRNLGTLAQRGRLETLVARLEIRPFEAVHSTLPAGVDLPTDDRPILESAIASGATHLLTGDRKAFGKYFGRKIAGVRVLRPSTYLANR